MGTLALRFSSHTPPNSTISFVSSCPPNTQYCLPPPIPEMMACSDVMARHQLHPNIPPHSKPLRYRFMLTITLSVSCSRTVHFIFIAWICACSVGPWSLFKHCLVTTTYNDHSSFIRGTSDCLHKTTQSRIDCTNTPDRHISGYLSHPTYKPHESDSVTLRST
jgi:hypothetical protein